MKSRPRGTWCRPSLVYVVAELVISPYYSMAARVAEVQDRLRASFPRTIEAQDFLAGGASPAGQPLWQFVTADQRHGVRLGTRSLALHATSYAGSSDFFDRWADVLEVVHGAGLAAFVERAGLRYIDLIVPSAGKLPTDYLVTGLHGIEPEGARSTGAMWASAFQRDGHVVNLRVAAPAPRGLLLPSDINPMPLSMPTLMVEAEQRVQAESTIGFLDTDCVKEVAAVFDADALLVTFRTMCDLAAKTFSAALSDSAREEWM